MGILYMSVNDFFGEYVRDHGSEMKDFEILIISRDIIASISNQNDYGQPVYRSKYKNVDFVGSLFPQPAVQEMYHGSTAESFDRAYRGQLAEIDMMQDICCLLDLAITDKKDIYILTSKSEYLMGFLDTFKEFVYDNFKYRIYSYADYTEDPNCIKDTGDESTYKATLAYQLERLGFIDEVTGKFFNSLFRDMEQTYRQVLMDKTIDELFDLAVKKGIYVNKHKPKEKIVDHIMDKLLSK